MNIRERAKSLAYLFIFAIPAVFSLYIFPGVSHAQVATCPVTICKEAPQLPPASDDGPFAEFTFGIVVDSIPFDFGFIANGACNSFNTAVGSTGFHAVEYETPGWVLDDIECDGQSVSITEHINGVSIACLQNGGSATCRFINLREVAEIPTMSEWSMIGAAAALGLIGVFYAVRRRRAEA